MAARALVALLAVDVASACWTLDLGHNLNPGSAHATCPGVPNGEVCAPDGSSNYHFWDGAYHNGIFRGVFQTNQCSNDKWGYCPLCDPPQYLVYANHSANCVNQTVPAHHYHNDNACDYDHSLKQHSVLIGIALDGHGIYGLYESYNETSEEQVTPDDLGVQRPHARRTGIYPIYTPESPGRCYGADCPCFEKSNDRYGRNSNLTVAECACYNVCDEVSNTDCGSVSCDAMLASGDFHCADDARPAPGAAKLKSVKATSSSLDCSMESNWIARRGASTPRIAPHRSPALALFALLLGTTAAFRATAPRRAATATVPSQRCAATPRRRAATPRRRAATVLRDTVGYAGEAGSPGELAARAYFGASSSPTPTRSLEDLFVDVETGAVDYGILAVENSLRGSINKAFDLLLQHDLRIYGEIVVTRARFDYAVPRRRGINLLKLESRPRRRTTGAGFTYVFFLGFEGTLRDEPCVAAVKALLERCAFVRFLGSYDAAPPVEREGLGNVADPALLQI
ncbi:arogenate dehydratase [Aureococcus anophagefferens]|nr:arogenate dehydratase [Aureococcus anophagefferens]